MEEKRAKRFSVFALLVLVGIFVYVLYLGSRANLKNKVVSAVKDATTTVQTSQPGLYPVSRFIDGDTIVVSMDGHDETLRLIGVDTPETHKPKTPVQCYGPQAAAFTKSFIGTSSVRLEADAMDSNRDKYGRLLRYVYLPDGRSVDAELIKQGYGFAYILFPFEKKAEFQQLEQQAKAAKAGLWSACQIHKDGEKEQTNNA
jgi:endonuclease YncB( thermonuclease family)